MRTFKKARRQLSSGAKLAGFSAILAAVFAVAALAGAAIDPKGESAASGAAHTGGHEAAPAPAHGEHAARALSDSADRLRLVIGDPLQQAGAREPLRFRIIDREGADVRDFDVEHTKRLHLIVVRRDLTGFQHLHPRQARGGEWTTPLTLRRAGTYRVFADFSRDGEKDTLASDLHVPGLSSLASLPAPARRVVAGGYSVEREGHPAHAGEPTTLRFTTSRGGRQVDVEPYLGADGHLVALREGDLAFLHVHPTEPGHGSRAIEFETTFPTPGNYRLFLQFRDAGQVHTAAFTEVVR